MPRILSLILLLIFSDLSLAFPNTIEERVKAINSLISSYPDSAHAEALKLLEYSKSSGNDFGVVKSNYTLAYLMEKKKGDFGKAIIYYLEAIRSAENSQDPRLRKTLVSLYKNSGIIFRKFKAYKLAEEYYAKALDIAIDLSDSKQILSIKYNLSAVYRDQNHITKAIEMLESTLVTARNSSMYFKIVNRLTFTYYEIKSYEKVDYYSSIILSSPEKAGAQLTAFSMHIKGKSAIDNHKYLVAKEYLNKALEIIKNNADQFPDKKAEFEATYDLGLNEFTINDLISAEKLFLKAEKYIPSITQKPEYFEIYKAQADLYYEFGNYEKSKHYENLYSESLSEYLTTQEEIRASDQRYNMDLITKRYFAEVEKQEQIADIMFYSRITSGGLLFLLIVVIAYFRIEKVRLRKSIEKELVSLRFLD